MAEEYGMRTARGDGAGKRNSPRKLKRIEIEIGDNGGHTVTHRTERGGAGLGPYVEPKKHIFGASEKDKLREHLHKHLALGETPKPSDDDEDEGGKGAESEKD